MSARKRYGRLASVLAMAALLLVTTVAPATAQRRGRDRPTRPPVTTPEPPPAPEPEPEPAPDPEPEPDPDPHESHSPDEHFVMMMIPHHHQALVMSRMAPTRSNDPEIRAFADRIDVEQSVEIAMMQNWQQWNGLEVTDPVQAYHHMLQMPAMLEQMGMATPAEMSALSSSSGAAFDRMYLELMIEHHQGALDMIVDVLTHGEDDILEFWATDMLTAQSHQIWQMEQMLADRP